MNQLPPQQSLTNNLKIFNMIVRLNKEDSAFFYFQLEANDGLCFYSTINHTPHDLHRDIMLRGDMRLKKELMQMINRLMLKFPIDIITDEEI